MADLYYLSFRDVSAPASLAVTAAELFRLPNVSSVLDWRTATLTGQNWVSWGQVAQVFHGKRVCFLLPGFNTPFEAGMNLVRKPKRPKWRPFVQINFTLHKHDSWRHFVDLAYWNVELGEDVAP